MPSTSQLNQNAPARKLEPGRIPLIDLASEQDLVNAIEDASLNTGFFQVQNSGLQPQTLSGALDAIAGFFDSPDDGPTKQGVHNRLAEKEKGWGPMFGEPAYQAGTVAHMESFDIGQQLEDEEYRRLGIPPNIWPELPEFRSRVLAFNREVTAMGRTIARAYSQILGESPDFINRNSGTSAPRTMRMLHYPARETASLPGQVGISAHTDFECFTLLYQTAPGLELTTVDCRWCEAPSDDGTFTVIMGDMLERLSNGWLKATGHRVSHTPWKRYSMVLFFALDADFVVSPLARFVSADRPAAYPPVGQLQHINNELERAGLNPTA